MAATQMPIHSLREKVNSIHYNRFVRDIISILLSDCLGLYLYHCTELLSTMIYSSKDQSDRHSNLLAI